MIEKLFQFQPSWIYMYSCLLHFKRFRYCNVFQYSCKLSKLNPPLPATDYVVIIFFTHATPSLVHFYSSSIEIFFFSFQGINCNLFFMQEKYASVMGETESFPILESYSPAKGIYSVGGEEAREDFTGKKH